MSGLPLEKAQKELRDAFIPTDIKQIYGLCEIIILKEYRDRKLGSKLYAAFENQVKQLASYEKIALWEVIKAKDDPKRPSDYFPRLVLDRFWEKRGYVKHPELHCTIPWKEIGNERESAHAFQFWLKEI